MSLQSTMGPLYLGGMGSSILFGITVVQAYIYFLRYPKDSFWMRLIVMVLCSFEAIDLGFVTHLTYHYLVSSFGNAHALAIVDKSLRLKFTITVITIVSVQTLYAIRVWKLAHQSRAMSYVIILVMGGAYGVALYTVIQVWRILTFVDFLENEIPLVVYLSHSYPTVVDLSITVSLCTHLRRNSSYFAETNHLVVRLMQYIIASGMATSACSVAALISYAALPKSMVWAGVEFLLARLYVNSYIAMLNTRRPHSYTDGVSSSPSRKFSGPFALRVHTQSQVKVTGDFTSHIELGEMPKEETGRSGNKFKNSAFQGDLPMAMTPALV